MRSLYVVVAVKKSIEGWGKLEGINDLIAFGHPIATIPEIAFKGVAVYILCL